jgi:hypothetical protein
VIRSSLVALAAASLFASAPAGALLLGPTPYTGFAGSPFDGITFVSFALEDFEDSAANAPGLLSVSGGIALNFGSLRDSVENGQSGVSWYTNGITSLTFNFDPGAPNGLPTHAGIVWTDVGCLIGEACPPIGLGMADVFFEAFDENALSLGVVGPSFLGDGAADGGTAEDRFFGATNAGGISKIVISMPDSNDWEVDHLQFGVAAVTPVAEPLGLALAGLVAAAFGSRRRS